MGLIGAHRDLKIRFSVADNGFVGRPVQKSLDFLANTRKSDIWFWLILKIFQRSVGILTRNEQLVGVHLFFTRYKKF